MSEADDALWDAYAATVIRTAAGAVLAGPGAIERVCGHVITAWNPLSVERPLEHNRAAHEALRAQLGEVVETVSSAPDGTWREEGFLVTGLTREALCALGRDFAQHAVFELDDDEVRVVSCHDGRIVRAARRRR